MNTARYSCRWLPCAVLVGACVGLSWSATSAQARGAAAPKPASGRIQIGPPGLAMPHAIVVDTVPSRRQAITREDLSRIPVEDLGSTTIAPYPIPGDHSRDPVQGPRTLNVPKPGMLTVAPLPAPEGAMPGPSGKLRFRGSHAGPGVKFQFDGLDTPDPDSGAVGLERDGAPVGTLVLPRFLSGPPVVYPEAALRDGVQGTVLVRVEVLADGRTGKLRMERGEPRLRHAALQSLRDARFAPGTVDGKPATVWTLVPVKFTLH
ncbi:MAG: TonB family protein [Candidatus Eisenbacteria bacterium]